MSVLEMHGSDMTRIFDASDPLPSPWDPVRAIRESDVDVIDFQDGEPKGLETHHKVVEGVGWLMLAHYS